MTKQKQKTIAIVAVAVIMILGFAYAVPSIHSDHVAFAAKTKCKSVDKEDETKKQKEESNGKEEKGC